MNNLIRNIPCIIFACFAAYFLSIDKTGWGWFVFLSLVTYRPGCCAEEEEEEESDWSE